MPRKPKKKPKKKPVYLRFGMPAEMAEAIKAGIRRARAFESFMTTRGVSAATGLSE